MEEQMEKEMEKEVDNGKSKLDEVQDRAVEAVLAALKKDSKALLVMPTGTGKTRVGLRIIESFLDSGHPVLWLTHRTPLKSQTRESGKKFFADYRVVDFHGKDRSFNADIVVAMVPTLDRDSGAKALRKHLRRGSFSLVVVDECHHSSSAQFKRVLDVLQEKEIPCLGLTATPVRPDGQSLHPCFGDVPAFSYTLTEAATDGTVAVPVGEVVFTELQVKGIPNKNGEYQDIKKHLDKKWVFDERNNLILDFVLKMAPAFWQRRDLKPKYVLFCVNVKHAQRMALLFADRGVRADFLVSDASEVSTEKREKVFSDFSSGKLDMLCVVDLLNEGIDIPSINTLVMARPTCSNIIYTQQLGRGTRLDKNKSEVLVIDTVDNYSNSFGCYTLKNAYPTPSGKRSYDTSYLKNADKIEIQKRIDAFEQYGKMDAYQNGGRNLYSREEAIEACQRLGATSRKLYDERRFEDPRLPSRTTARKLYGKDFFIVIGGRKMDPEGNKKVILAFCKKFGRKPAGRSLDNEERKLSRAMRRYCSKSGESFDADFAAKLSKYNMRDPEGNKKAILAFCKKFGRKPSGGSLDNEERKLGRAMRRYCSKSSESFDADFAAKLSKYDDATKERRTAASRKPVICVETGRRFKSATEADHFLKLSHGVVSGAICAGHKAGRYTWRYAEDGE
jgi:superfamily II DNA or RNA helicase